MTMTLDNKNVSPASTPCRPPKSMLSSLYDHRDFKSVHMTFTDDCFSATEGGAGHAGLPRVSK